MTGGRSSRFHVTCRSSSSLPTLTAYADRVQSGISNAKRDQRGNLLPQVSVPGMYSGPLDLNRTTECAECRHPLVGDHTVKVKGTVDPAGQFNVIENGPAKRTSSEKSSK